MVFHLHI